MGLSDGCIKPPSIFNNTLAPASSYNATKTKVKFVGSCLKQDKTTFNHGKRVIVDIIYEINLWDHGYDDYPTLESSLFAAVKSIKYSDNDKCKYSGYGIGFDRRETFSVANGFGKNVIIFGVI